MVGNGKQGIHPSTPFDGIRFFLSGFNPNLHHQVKLKLESVGAVDCENYGPNCTHVIVHDLLFDEPICETARRYGKILVTSLWVDHSLDAVEPVDATSTMVRLMGAQFSKPLLASKVTHLVCYKFEGEEKYDLAKRMKKIKLINHFWLEDCLQAWKILPEELYSKSSYEVETMETEAKDSEEQTEDIAGNSTEERSIDVVPHCQNEIDRAQHCSVILSKMSSPSIQHGFSTNVNTNYVEFPIKEEIKPNQASKTGSLNQMGQQSPSHNRQDHEMDAEISCNLEAAKFTGLSYSRKTPTGKSSIPSLVGEKLGNLSGADSKSLAGSGAGKSDGKLKGNLADKAINEDVTSNLEPDEEKGASACAGVLSSKHSADFGACKHSFKLNYKFDKLLEDLISCCQPQESQVTQTGGRKRFQLKN